MEHVMTLDEEIERENEEGFRLHSTKSEMALIGAILINPDVIELIDLRADEFFDKHYAKIFETIRKMRAEKIDIDVTTLSDRLDAIESKNHSDELYSIVIKTPSSLHAESYAAIIRDKAKRRNIFKLADEMKKIATDGTQDTTGRIAKVIELLTTNEAEKATTISISEAVGDYHNALLDRMSGKTSSGIMTGFQKFDKVTGGFQPEQITILSGEPSVGKSLFAMQLVMNISKKIPCAVNSIEMGKMLTTERMIANVGRLNTQRMKAGLFTDEEMERYNEALEAVEQRKLYISNTGNWNLLSLKADIMKQKIQHDVQFVVVDYLYLMSDAMDKDEITRTTIISRGLKLICMDLGISMLAIHSLNKMGMDKRNGKPGMAQLRGSGQIGYDADMILMLTEYDENYERLLLTKQELENIKMLFFDKGRTLIGKNGCVLVKHPTLPIFNEYTPDFERIER